MSDEIQHYGVKGMKWGVRRNLKKLSPGKARTDYIKSYDKKWEDKVNKNPKATILEKTIANAMKKSLEKGSLYSIDTLLTRVYGKPKETAE